MSPAWTALLDSIMAGHFAGCLVLCRPSMLGLSTHLPCDATLVVSNPGVLTVPAASRWDMPDGRLFAHGLARRVTAGSAA